MGIPVTTRRRHAALAAAAALTAAALAVAGCGERGERSSAEGPGGGAPMQVTSEALEDGARMPGRFATERGGGRNVSPPLAWSDAPEGTRSFVVTVIDRHPAANDWIHWAVVDVPPDVTSLPEGSSGSVPGGRELVNTFGTRGWGGPQPPPGRGPHRYEVSVRALSVPELDVPERPSAEDLEGEMEGVVLASGALTVAYER